MQKKAFNRLIFLLPLLPLLLGLMFQVLDLRPQQLLRLQLFDAWQGLQPRQYVPAPVRIIDLDEASIARLGQWPWPRTRIADMVDQLRANGAAVVAFDVLFAEPDRTSPRQLTAQWSLSPQLREEVAQLPDHDAILAATLARSADVVVGVALERNGDAGAATAPQKARFVQLGGDQTRWLHHFAAAVNPLPQLEAAAAGAGAISFVPDADGVVRRAPLLLRVGEQPTPSLLLEALRVAQGESNIILRGAGQNSGLQEVRVGGVAINTDARAEVWSHYTRAAPQRYIPAWRLLAGEAPRQQLEGHIVLVGSSAQGLMDLRFSPFGLIPGVEIHAQVLEQILTDSLLVRPAWARGAEAAALALACLLVGFVALSARAQWSAGVCLIVLTALFAGSWFAFSQLRLLLDAASPALAALMSFVLCGFAHHFTAERRQRWIKEAFSRYVSPNRVEYLIDHPEAMELGGRRQQCSFVFTDLASFTSLMEKLDPGQALLLLNAYLDEMIAIAFRHDGTLDRIVGDAVAIVFSAPAPQFDHQQRALDCAMEMDRFASRYAADLQGRGVPFGMTRIGVHGGEVIVGNFGGANIFDYRALGDAVNTAARLESVNKQLGIRMCVSEFIVAQCPHVPVRPVARLVLKGKSEAVKVFEPVRDDGLQRAPLAEYTRAWEAMAASDEQAPALFAALAAAWPEDPLAALHHARLSAGEKDDLMVMSEK